MTVKSQALQTITPRHREIMLRLTKGQPGKKIREDLGISQARFSIIIHSPLFQIELKKMMMRREKMQTLEDNFLDAAELGAKFHKEILEAKPGVYSTDTKIKSATTMVVLASKLIKPEIITSSEEDAGEPESGLSYEERLRKVTVEESIKTVTPKQKTEEAPDEEITTMLEAMHPPDEHLELDDVEDLLFGDEEDDLTELPMKIDDILAQASGEKN